MIKIQNILNLLNESKIEYVHWKSNLNIDKALSGEDDLQLLVHPNHRFQIEKIFLEEKVIRAYSIKDDWQPDILHFLGFDEESLKIVHIHLHFSLTLGYDFDKNYTLPIIDFYLKNRFQYRKIYLPQLEKEYIILTIRLLLKKSLGSFLLELPHNQVKLLQKSRLQVISGGAIEEFIDLQRKVDRRILKQLFKEEFKIFSYEEFVSFEKVISVNKSLQSFFLSSRKIKSLLRLYKRNSDVTSFLLSFKILTKIRVLGLFGINPYIKKPENGGRVIALVGGDRAGKSTNIEIIKSTFSKHFELRTFHIGRPPKTSVGNVVRLLKIPYLIFGKKGHAYAISLLALALDRRRHFEKGKKFADKGGVSVLDRMPSKGLSMMNCPKISQIPGLQASWMCKLENSIYNRFTGVDKLFLLKADSQIAIKKSNEDDSNGPILRSVDIWDNNRNAPFAKEIDSGIESPYQVSRFILTEIWSCIYKPFKRLEFYGLNGTGKSYALKIVSNNYSNVSYNIPVKKFPFTLLKAIIFNLGFILKNYNKMVLLAYFHYKTALLLLNKWEKKKSYPRCNFLLDQSLIFQIAFLSREGILSELDFNKDLELIKKFFSNTYYLKANYEILYQRVNNRPAQEARAFGLDYEDFVAFCKSYEIYYDQILKVLGSQIVDTNNSTADIFSRI